MGSEFESVDVEDLRTDVAVQPDQAEVVGREHSAHRVHRVAAGQRETELLILVRGGDELVGVCFDTDGDADEHVLDGVQLTGDGVEAIDFGERVQHDVPDADLDGGPQFGHGLVVAVQRDLLRREAGAQRYGEFTPGCDVEAQSLLVHPPGDLGAQECLGRVVDTRFGAEGLGDLAAPRSEIVLVDDEQRCAVGLGEFGDGDTGDASDAVVAAAGVAWPHVPVELVQFCSILGSLRQAGCVRDLGVTRPRGMRVHIRSGALTPRRPSPLART